MKKVLLVNWDNYPNNMSGGVYSWEKTLVERMPEYEFTVVNLVSNPNVNGRFTVPSHVKQVIDMPLFGSNRYEEFYTAPTTPLIEKIASTTDRAIVQGFIPLYRQLLANLFSNYYNPAQLSQIIYTLH